ncbi:nucleotidyl transferase AbiEii/AbiGii toxin family protein [Adlercreutzia sp. ZJ473]|uniref:nucleotidyl transferase AbiEii/AbiGii toxin family protein n=1 Tax=Adlercreutzia sp. ZJ473 TaxID=2722822 RepID=UPI00353032A8
MYLHNDSELFNAAVLTTASELKLVPGFVTKDYFIYMVLKGITARYPDIIFKGGTSLSKCHGVIDRFSEDIDLGVEAEHLTEGQRKRIKAAVVDAIADLGLAISNLDEIRSRREYNKYLVRLPESLSAAGLKEDLVVETAFMTPVSPSVEKTFSCFIYECLKDRTGSEELLERFDLAPLSLAVTSLERCFCDKVYAICDYYMGQRPSERCSRHIYDLHKMLPMVALDEKMRDLFAKVRLQRKSLPYCLSAEDGVVLSEVLNEFIDSRYYASDYREVTSKLLNEPVAYEEAIKSLCLIADFLSERSLSPQ